MKLTFLIVATAGFTTACENSAGIFDANLPTQDGNTEAAAGKQGVGVKNYEQIYLSMLQVTGVNENANPNGGLTPRGFYDSNKGSLPNTFSIQEFQPNHVNTIVNLSGEICDTLVRDATSRVSFFEGTSFVNITNPTTGTLNALLGNDSQKNSLIDLFFRKFWGEEIAPTTGRAEAKAEALTLVNDLAAGLTNNSDSMIKVTDGLCTAVLSSGPVIYY